MITPENEMIYVALASLFDGDLKKMYPEDVRQVRKLIWEDAAALLEKLHAPEPSEESEPSTEDQIAAEDLASRRAAEAIALDEWRWKKASEKCKLRSDLIDRNPSLVITELNGIIHEYRRLVRDNVVPL